MIDDKAPLAPRRRRATAVPGPVPPDDTVVLVSPRGEPIGQSTRLTVHTTKTPLHLAFSLHLFNAAGQVLLTRRALGKATWPGVWTNSCCGHPRVGESIADAVRRRLRYELGVEVEQLTCVLPDFTYRATDASGIVENEICPVYAGGVLHPNLPLTPNSGEVMDWAWADWGNIRSAMFAAPFAFSPWAVQQVAQLAESPHP